MARFFNFIYNNRYFVPKVKAISIYYIRFILTGILIGALVLILWDSFLTKDLVLKINDQLLDQINYLINASSYIKIPFIIFSSIALVTLVAKGFQTFLRGSLIFLGVIIWFYINNYNYFTNPTFIFEFEKIKNIFNLISCFSFFIIVSDLIIIILKPILRKIYYNITAKIDFIKSFFDREAIQIFLANKFNFYSKPININDNPLKSQNEIISVRKTMNDNDLFSSFVTSLNKLQSLILNDDIDKEYAKCICLDGPWGSGKTSLINIIRKNIKGLHRNNLLWIDFYPWNFNDPTELIRDFFDTLNKAVIEKYKIDLQPNLEIYVDLVTPLVESSGFFSGLKNIFLKMPFFAPKNLNSIKHDLCKKLKDIPDKIVIVLDDLDRLGLEEIETVLKLVRQISSFPNILFVLPFDYRRVSELIIENRGSGYSDYLGKIVNNKIKLTQYSYNELESIFIHSIKSNANQNEIKILKDVFSLYVQEINRSRFENIRLLENKTKLNTDTTLTPIYEFATKITSIFYPDILSKDIYNKTNPKFIDNVKSLLNFYQDNYSTKGSLLELDIFEKYSLIAKRKIRDNILPIKSQIDSNISQIGTNQDEIDNINAKWEALIKSLDNGDRLEAIENRVIDLKNINLPTQNNILLSNLQNIGGYMNQISEDLSGYKNNFDNNKKYHEDVRNWLAEKLTARRAKELSVKLFEYRDSIENSLELMKRDSLELAKSQYYIW